MSTAKAKGGHNLMRILLTDNYDSFTYNLQQLFTCAGSNNYHIEVRRDDEALAWQSVQTYSGLKQHRAVGLAQTRPGQI